MNRRRELMMLRAEVEVLELELELEALAAATTPGEVAAGELEGGWRRGLHPWERRTLFQTVEEEVGGFARRLTGLVEEYRREALALVGVWLEGQPSVPGALLDAQAGGLSTVPGLRPLVEESVGRYREVLEEALVAGAESVTAEAAAQGVDVELRLPAAARLADDLDVAARRLAQRPQRELLDALAAEATRASTAQPAGELRRQVLQAGAALSERPLADVASSAASNLYGRGRVEQGAAAGPERIYASELLDRNTCGPCADVDGTEYGSLEAARRDYPDGYYRSCEGGVRCRGTLVFVWEEAPATVP